MSLARQRIKACGIDACLECSNNTCTKCIDGHVARPPDVIWWDDNLAGHWEVDHGHCILPFERDLMRAVGGFLAAVVVILIIGAIGQTLIAQCSGFFKGLQRERFRKKRQQMSTEVNPEESALLDGSEPPSELEKDPEEMEKQERRDGQRMTDTEKSWESIKHGLHSWANTRFTDWTTSEPTRQKFGSIHEKFVVGVGLPLFYNFHFLPLVTGILGTITMYWAAAQARITFPQKASIMKLEESDVEDLKQNELNDDVLKFAQAMFFATALLYVLLLGMTLAFAVAQRRFKQSYDAATSSISDYTVQVEGVPEGVVDEGKLQSKIEEELQCHGRVYGVSIGYNLAKDRICDDIFQLMEYCFEDSDVNYKPPNDKLKEFGYQRYLASEDGADPKRSERRFRELLPCLRGSGHAFIVFRAKHDVDQIYLSRNGFWINSEVEIETANQAREVLNALNTSSSARLLAGRKHLTMKQQVAEAMGQATYSNQMEMVQIRQRIVVGNQVLNEGTYVVHPWEVKEGATVQLKYFVRIAREHQADEPVSIQWYNVGTLPSTRACNKVKAGFIVLIVFILVISLVYLPLAYYLMIPYAIAEAAASFWTGQAQGMIFGLCNNLLNMALWIKVHDIGYYRKRDLDEAFMLASTAVGLFNTAYFILSSLYLQVLLGFAKVNVGGVVKRSDLQAELALAQTLYQTLVPGWLFTGVLIGEAMGKAVPVVQNFLLTSVVFVCRCLPGPLRQVLTIFIPWNPKTDHFLTARMAEHIFQPCELALAWNYSNFIVLPTTCLCSLFILSPHTWKMFFILSLWTLFMYAFHRFTIIYVSRKAIHASPHLEERAEELWAIPLSVIGSASIYWGVRSGVLPELRGRAYWLVPVAFFLMHSMYQLMLRGLGDMGKNSLDISDERYSETAAKLRYTWFNSNPVHVLKSRFCENMLGELQVKACTPFEYGKEYLLLDVEDEEAQTMGRLESASSMESMQPREGQAAAVRHAGT